MGFAPHRESWPGRCSPDGDYLCSAKRPDYLITFDADGQHQAQDIPLLLESLRTQLADFALGSRFLGKAPGIPWTRRFTLRLAVWFTRLFSGVSVTDTHNGIRAMTRRGAERLQITMNRMEHASEIIDQIARSGLRYVEVPVTISYTRHSLVKGQRSSAALRMAARLIAERMRQ